MKKIFTKEEQAKEMRVDKSMFGESWTLIINSDHELSLICDESQIYMRNDGDKFTVIKRFEEYQVENAWYDSWKIEDYIRILGLEDFEYEVTEYPVAILNTSILTSLGTFTLSALTLEESQELTRGEILSAVGHQSTADILTELLQINVPMNRIQFAQQPGQKAVVFKLNGRAPEGTILTREQIEEIGYSFQLLEMQ